MKLFKSIQRAVVGFFGGKLKEDLLGGDGKGGDDEPSGKSYRPLARRGFRAPYRDLRTSLQEEQNKQAFKAFLENAFIRRIAKMTADFIVGNGITVKSKNPDVQRELDEWWNDPVNDLEKRHYQWAIEHGLYGEIILERVANVFTGRHRYNSLDTLFVARVVAHPKYPCVPASMEFWTAGKGGQTVTARILNGVPEQAMLSAIDSLEDDPVVFYFRTNNLTGALRGHSNYYPLLEWADVLDNAAFTMGERMILLSMYIWHLKTDNLDEETKKRYVSLLQEANPGSALVTGKNLELNAVTPDLKNADFTEGARFLRNLISGAAGVPEHWMGEGGDVNRATATAMNLPTLRSFLQQQREFVSLIRTLAKANLASVASRGRIPVTEVDNFTVQVDPMDAKDVTSMAAAMNQLVAALSNAKVEGWMSDAEARQLIKSVLGGVIELEDAPPTAAPAGVAQPAAVQAAVERLKKKFYGSQDDAEGEVNGKPVPSDLSAS